MQTPRTSRLHVASCVICAGPISSSFVNKYGCRAVTIAGAVLAFVCLVLSAFAQNVITLYFTIGLGAGKYTG
jgi:MFS family permease